MPWHIQKRDGKFCVIKDADNSVAGCHASRGEAADQIRALYANEVDNDDEETAALVEAVRILVNKLEGNSQEDSTEPQKPEVVQTDIEVPVAEHFAWEGVITVEGVETGDGRLFSEGAVTWKDELLPIPFTWQRSSQPGHDGNVTIGRVDSIFRTENGEIQGRGVILSGPDAPPEAIEYLNLLKAGAAGWVSIDGDSAEFDIIDSPDGDPFKIKQVFSSLNIRSLCAVSISAFETAKIQLADDVAVEFSRLMRDLREDEPIIAAGIPVNPPAEWLETPKLTELTPLTITDDGRVFGHLAGKETCHIGMGTCKTSPRNCNYDEYFHLGALKTAEGDIVNVGHMTFGGSHAPLDHKAQAAAAYYDSTSRVSADIRCGEDEFGTWVAGALRPGLSEEDLREIRSAPLSGDWRPIKGKLQLIAAHAVNVPGFPISRAKVLVASGITEAVILTEDCGCDLNEQYKEMMFEMDMEEVEA